MLPSPLPCGRRLRFLGLFFGVFYLGNNVVNTLLSVLLRQASTRRYQFCQIGPVAGIKVPVGNAPRQNASRLADRLLWAGIGFRLVSPEQAIRKILRREARLVRRRL